MNFCRAALCKRGLSRHAVSVVHPPVTFVDSVETNKHIFQKFLHRHSSFDVPNVMAIFGREPPPQWGVECRHGVCRNRDSEPTSGFITCCQYCDRLVLSTR